MQPAASALNAVTVYIFVKVSVLCSLQRRFESSIHHRRLLSRAEKMNPIAALLYFFTVIGSAQADEEAVKKVKTLLRSSAPALHISDQDIQICAEAKLERDCHSQAIGGRCVYCPDQLSLGREDETATGACYPAAIYGLACPRGRRKVDQEEQL